MKDPPKSATALLTNNILIRDRFRQATHVQFSVATDHYYAVIVGSPWPVHGKRITKEKKMSRIN
jgi:hypothetical protein